MRHSELDFVDYEGVAAAKARSPHARQNCQGGMRQLTEVAGETVQCRTCLRIFTTFDIQKDRDVLRPIVPSHLPDYNGLQKAAHEAAKRNVSATPRPY